MTALVESGWCASSKNGNGATHESETGMSAKLKKARNKTGVLAFAVNNGDRRLPNFRREAGILATTTRARPAPMFVQSRFPEKGRRERPAHSRYPDYPQQPEVHDQGAGKCEQGTRPSHENSD